MENIRIAVIEHGFMRHEHETMLTNMGDTYHDGGWPDTFFRTSAKGTILTEPLPKVETKRVLALTEAVRESARIGMSVQFE